VGAADTRHTQLVSCRHACPHPRELGRRGAVDLDHQVKVAALRLDAVERGRRVGARDVLAVDRRVRHDVLADGQAEVLAVRGQREPGASTREGGRGQWAG
jgi:hypothetical protein